MLLRMWFFSEGFSAVRTDGQTAPGDPSRLYHTKYYVLSPMEAFMRLPSEQQRLGVHGATENEWGMAGHVPKPLPGCGEVPEEAAGGSWMRLW